MFKNPNQASIGGPEHGFCLELGLAPRFVRQRTRRFSGQPAQGLADRTLLTCGLPTCGLDRFESDLRSGRLPVIVVQHSTQPRTALDGCSAVNNKLLLDNQPIVQALVIALPVIMLHEFPDGLPQRTLSE